MTDGTSILEPGSGAAPDASAAAPPEEAPEPAPTGEAVLDEVVVPDPQAGGSRSGIAVFAFALSAASLFGMISASGIWEPYELNVADLARRIAVALLGGKQLVIDGASNAVPTAGELGKGELPFTCVALGLRLFGLREWAGRLPLALWAFLGVVALYFLLARLVDRAAAAFSVIALSTMPLYFLGARTILGDVVTMAALAVAVAGLAIATFDDRLRPWARWAWAVFGVLGMGAGFGARGVLLGVAVPALSVGLAYVVRGRFGADRVGRTLAGVSLALGTAAVVAGIRALIKADEHQLVRLLGATVDRHRAYQAHDSMVLELGHALFPWSAVVPFALGRLLRPPLGVDGPDAERENGARITILLVSVLCFAAYAGLAPTLGVLPYSGAFALAAATGLMLRDFERGAPGSRTVALGVAALVVLFLGDFKNFPEKALSPFVVENAKFPESFKEKSMLILELGGLASAALFGLLFLEREEGQKVFVREEHKRYYRALRTSHDGNIAFGLLALEVALIALAVATVVSDRGAHWPQIETMAAPVRQVAKVGYLLLPVVIAAPSLVMLARDVCRVVLRKVHATRATAAILALGAFGATLSFGYYPILARQMSPKEVFESYQRLARPGENLAMMGSGSGPPCA